MATSQNFSLFSHVSNPQLGLYCIEELGCEIEATRAYFALPDAPYQTNKLQILDVVWQDAQALTCVICHSLSTQRQGNKCDREWQVKWDDRYLKVPTQLQNQVKKASSTNPFDKN